MSASSTDPAAPPATAAAGPSAADAVSEGLVDLLSPMVSACDGGIRSALDSQVALSQQLDRVSTELQTFLTKSQVPSFSTHATRVAELHKRVGAASSTLTQVQARLQRLEQLADRLQHEEHLASVRSPTAPQ